MLALKHKLDNTRILTYDIGFKSVFGRSTELMSRLISTITGINYDLLKDNMILIVNEIPVIKKNEKLKRCDFIVRIGDGGLINLELNRYSNAFSRRKNFSYVTSLYGRRTTKGTNYELNLLLNQININAYNTGDDVSPLEIYELREEKSNKVYYKEDIQFKIFELNIAKCYQLYYNESDLRNDPIILLGALLYCANSMEMSKVSGNFFSKKENEIFMDNVKSLYDNSDLLTIEELTQMEQSCFDSTIKDYEKRIKQAKEEAKKLELLKEENSEKIKQLKEETDKLKEETDKLKEETDKLKEETDKLKEESTAKIDQTTREIVSNMLKQGFKYEVISSITGKSIDEIKDIENNE